MTKHEIQLARELAVFDVLTDFEGASLVYEEFNRAFIRLGGMTAEQKKFHRIASVVTVGLWLPMYGLIKLLRRPRILVVHVTGDGTVLRWLA